MPRYLYQARNGHGAAATGTIQAADPAEVRHRLRTEGLTAVKITPVNDADLDAAPVSLERRGRGIKRDHVINFAHQLAVMLDTGVPITEALQCATEQTTNDNFRRVLEDVLTQVQAGNEFSAALRKYPKVFPTVMTSLIRASEVSGGMGRMLDRISTYLTKEQQTRRKVKSAVSYPIFMLAMAVGVTIFLMTFVLPKFTAIFASRGAALPAPTRLLIATSNLLINYWWAWVGAVVVGIVGGFLVMRTSIGRRGADYLKLHTPVIGNLFAKLYITRACRTMGTMISAGVSMLDMISIVKQVTNNVFYEDLWNEVDARLRQGAQLSDPLFASSLMPRSICQMIYSGERSGRLGQVMARVAEYTEDEFDDAVKTTTQFIEPLLVTGMGLLVGFIAISMLLPIFSVAKVATSG